MKTVLHWIYDRPERLAAHLNWLPVTVARLVVGWTFVATGWAKLHALENVTAYFAQLGIPFPELQAPFVASTELACGALILAGLGTRLAALPLIATMVVAIATAQWPNVGSAAGLFGLVETLYVVIFGWIAVAGPGPASLDAVIARLRPDAEGERTPPLVHPLTPLAGER